MNTNTHHIAINYIFYDGRPNEHYIVDGGYADLEDLYSPTGWTHEIVVSIACEYMPF